MISEIVLKRGKEESLLRYHPWVFSGAIHHLRGEEPAEGDIVDIYSSGGEFLGRGHFQIGSITVRILSFQRIEIDQNWWNESIEKAYKLRKVLGLVDNDDTNCYRLVHGEGDNLPGLIVDIYGSCAVVQSHSVGMYLSRENIAEAIKNIYGDKITRIFDKSSATLPYNAGLDATDEYLYSNGEIEDYVLENGFKFHVNWEQGQKTGFFLDQRENRALVARYAKGRKVLNTFCYTGGFSVYAMGEGAAMVDSVDSSERAVDLAAKNVELNFGKDAPHRTFACDTFKFMKDSQEKYDLIILDPPAFAKHHKVLGNALQGYRRLNAKAIADIAPGGILFTFSCSQAVSAEHFRNAVFSAAAIAGRKVRILHKIMQPCDHPINIYHPEGEYLKGLVLYVE